MILGDPLLDHLNEFFGPGHNLLRLSLGGDNGRHRNQSRSVPPASVEVITVGPRAVFQTPQFHLTASRLQYIRTSRNNVRIMRNNTPASKPAIEG